MVSQHQKRAIERAKCLPPKNVTVIIDGILKVIPFKQYKKEFPDPVPEQDPVTEPAEVN